MVHQRLIHHFRAPFWLPSEGIVVTIVTTLIAVTLIDSQIGSTKMFWKQLFRCEFECECEPQQQFVELLSPLLPSPSSHQAQDSKLARKDFESPWRADLLTGRALSHSNSSPATIKVRLRIEAVVRWQIRETSKPARVREKSEGIKQSRD